MKKYPHETTVLGLFRTPEEARRAMKDLEHAPISPEDISFVASQAAYEQEEMVQLIAGDRVHIEAKRAGKIGGICGAVVGGLTGIAAMATAGASLLATGPLIAVLTGAGGVLGGLLGTGFGEEQAKEVDEGLAKGDVLVMVHAPNKNSAQQVKEVFTRRGADRIHAHH